MDKKVSYIQQCNDDEMILLDMLCWLWNFEQEFDVDEIN